MTGMGSGTMSKPRIIRLLTTTAYIGRSDVYVAESFQIHR